MRVFSFLQVATQRLETWKIAMCLDDYVEEAISGTAHVKDVLQYAFMWSFVELADVTEC